MQFPVVLWWQGLDMAQLHNNECPFIHSIILLFDVKCRMRLQVCLCLTLDLWYNVNVYKPSLSCTSWTSEWTPVFLESVWPIGKQHTQAHILSSYFQESLPWFSSFWEKKTLKCFLTTYGVLELRFMWVMYIPEPCMLYQ